MIELLLVASVGSFDLAVELRRCRFDVAVWIFPLNRSLLVGGGDATFPMSRGRSGKRFYWRALDFSPLPSASAPEANFLLSAQQSTKKVALAESNASAVVCRRFRGKAAWGLP